MFPRGTEAVPRATLVNAEANVTEFIRDILVDVALPPDCELRESDIDLARLPQFDADGRFAFTVTIPTPTGGSVILTVLMPGLPLNQVNFGARVDDRPREFPRLYLDGNSWLWRNAVGVAASRVTVAWRT